MTLTYWLINVNFYSYILHVGWASTGGGGVGLKRGGERAVLDQRKAYLLPWRHQSMLLQRSHTFLFTQNACVPVRSCSCLVTVTPVSSANFVIVLNMLV